MSQNNQITAEESSEVSPISNSLPRPPITQTTTSPFSPVDAGPSKLPISPFQYTSDDDRTSEEQQAEDPEEDIIALQGAQTQVVFGLEEEYEGSDAGYETSSTGTDIFSATSSTRDYVYENGRRYHSYRDGAYNFSNEISEQSREQKKHLMMRVLCHGRLYYAPIGSNPQNMLDLGTGTGEWAIEMADLFPSARVAGLDLSPIQPGLIPPNLKFVIDDIEDEWVGSENRYDFIHTRHMVMAVKNWPRLLRQSLKHLKPGGWMELQEINHYPELPDHHSDLQLPHQLAKYWGLIKDALAILNVNIHATKFLLGMMEEAGFVNVQQRIFYIPIGDWSANKTLKASGRYWKEVLVEGLEPISMGTLTRGLNWTAKEVMEMIVSVRHAYLNDCPKLCMPLYIVYGQKPEAGPGTGKRKADTDSE